MPLDRKRRGGNDSGPLQDDATSSSADNGQDENTTSQPADDLLVWNPSERVRLQVTLDAETAFKLDSIARKARKPRGVIIAKLLSQVCKGYRSPTFPKAVNDLLRAS